MSKGISQQLENKIKQYQNLQQKIASLQQQIQTLKIEELNITTILEVAFVLSIFLVPLGAIIVKLT